MVDEGQHQHRPRTSKDARNRLVAAAEAAGAENPSYHESVLVALTLLEIATDTPRCRNCGSKMGKSGDRYDCHECPWTPTKKALIPIEEPSLRLP